MRYNSAAVLLVLALALAACGSAKTTATGSVAAGAPATATVPETAVPPTATAQGRVYFEFGRADLTPGGADVVKAALAALRASPEAKATLVGKADLVGDDASNLRLSKRRADAVRRMLLVAGIKPDRITERWVGFREPPIPTAAGIREPRNRVVEISVSPPTP